MTIGQRIAELRKKCGYSQIYVAEKLGVSRQAVSRWEMDAAAPDTYNLIALAELLGVTVEYITLGREATPTVTEAAVIFQKRGMGLLNIILITLVVWIGAGVLLYIFSIFKIWTEIEAYILLSVIVAPLPFAIAGRRIRDTSAKSLLLLYLSGFLTAIFVAGVSFLLEAIYMVTNYSLSTFEFHTFDGGGTFSFAFLGLTLIQMAVMLPICLWRKINMLGRILLTVLSAPAVLLLGYAALELFGYGRYYINKWWWTAICALIYCAAGWIYWLAAKKSYEKS